MNGEIKNSNQLSWVLVLLLGSPVIVQCIKITKESFFGPKHDERTTAMLEAALTELINQRKAISDQPKVVYVPVAPKTISPIPFDQSTQQLAMNHLHKEMHEQMERMAIMRQQLVQQRPVQIVRIQPQLLQAQHKKLPDERPLHEALSKT